MIFKKILPFFLIFAVLLTSAFCCGKNCGIDADISAKMQPITLNYWRPWDESEDFTETIAKYQAMHPNINIVYKRLRYEEYEKELIESFASDRGPDIFSIHNTWTRKYQSKGLISPMPEMITMVFPYQTGNLKKEVGYKKQTVRFNPASVRNKFVDAVHDDVIINVVDGEKEDVFVDKVFGLPLAIDTLAMYYNRDLFNNAGITNPPQFWNREFQQDVKKLSKQNNKGEIMQSGVALGGSKNIERSVDILSVLMMQNGSAMMEGGEVEFHKSADDSQSSDFNPGLDALRFYTDFSNPAKEVYSWNNTLDNSVDMFVQGKLAIMFGYSYQMPIIKSRASRLNISVTKLPQIEGNSRNVNFANYWVETVSSKILTNPDNLKKGKTYASDKQEAAWDFLRFITSEEEVKTYLAKTKKPSALRSVVGEQINDDEIGIFADQALTARSWYKGEDANSAEAIMNEMVDQVVGGQMQIGPALNRCASKVQQTVKKE